MDESEERSEGMQEVIDSVFPEGAARRSAGLCPRCGLRVSAEDFEDDMSAQEYEVSGMCHQCQDEVFKDEDE